MGPKIRLRRKLRRATASFGGTTDTFRAKKLMGNMTDLPHKGIGEWESGRERGEMYIEYAFRLGIFAHSSNFMPAKSLKAVQDTRNIQDCRNF